MTTAANYLDGARPVRAGEELDVARLRPLFERHLGCALPELEVQQFPGGYSNLTYLVRAGETEFVLRRPPVGSTVKSAHDMRREHRILAALSQHVPWAPRPLFFCDDGDALGCEFYVMQRLRGVVLRRTLPQGLELDAAAAARISELLLGVQLELHRLDYDALGLSTLGKPDGYVARQVDGWTRRYANARTDDIPSVPLVADWLANHQPTSPSPRILHNDLKFDNVVYDSERFTAVVGVLDWEMATLGDPLMDLGTTLCYWVEASDPPELQALSFGPTMLPGMLTRSELANRYAHATRVDVSNIVFYYVFGLFKTAVVCQQIYARFREGKTTDPRFAGLGDAVRVMADKALDHLRRDTL